MNFLLQGFKDLFPIFFEAHLSKKKLFSIFACHSEKMPLIPSCGNEDLYFLPLQLCEPFLGKGLQRNCQRNQNLLRDKFTLMIVLSQKGGKDLFIRKTGRMKGKTLAPQEFSCSYKEGVDNDRVILVMEPDYILVEEVPRHNLLPFNHLLNMFNLVSNLSSHLEM